MRYIKRFVAFNKAVKSRPTKYFLFLIAVFFGLFLQAYMHNYNIVYIVLFFVFAVAGSSCIFGRLNLWGLDVQAVQSGEIYADTAATLPFKVINNAKNDAYAIYFEKSYISSIASNDFVMQNLQKTFSFRGYATIDALEIQSFFPFGHIKFSKKISINQRYLIYPKPQGVPLKKAFAKELAHFGQLESFEDLKSYEAGESLSKIHWASVAKGELKSKKFSYKNEDNTLHFYFTRAGNSTEKRLCQLTLWVIQASKSGFNYVVHLPHATYESKQKDKDAILAALALY
jgi:uncharacterized protein (DUF58 family)